MTSPRYVLWFKDSTHTIYWLTKWLKKSLKQFTDQIKKKYWGVRNELPIKDKIKALKYKSCLSFRTCQKKIVEFTDSTHTLCWPTNIAKKAASCWNKSFYICQYQIPSNINNVCVSWHFQIAIVYRPDLHNLQTRGEKFKST